MAGQFYGSRQDNSMKPMKLATVTSRPSLYSHLSEDSAYNPLAYSETDSNLRQLEIRDQKIKRAVRILKFVSRLAATVCSGVTLAPMIMTIVKWLQTKDKYFDVDGVQRTAWNPDCILWYTFMYASIAGVSFLMNLVIVGSYFKSIQQANKASSMATRLTYAIDIVHVLVWAVAAGIFRYGKVPVDGQNRDLWGWTCSATAQDMQDVVTDVNYQRYCNLQTISFDSGLANVAMGLLSLAIFTLAVLRLRSKKRVMAAAIKFGGDLEPLRA